MRNSKTYLSAALCVVLALVMSLGIMQTYVHRKLSGDFTHHLMQGKRFGMPPLLQQHGLTPLYYGEQAGWDGQFYYDIANDPFDHANTRHYVDADAYRFQRIGLPLSSKIVAIVTGQSWVSPLTYYATNLALILMATAAGAAFFQRRGYSGFWILFWSFGPGTQLVLLNGLPDAFADAWVILGLIAFVHRRHAAYAFCLTLAALSRETYVVFPIGLAMGAMLRGFVPVFADDPRERLGQRLARTFRICAWHAVPVVVFVAWQGFIRMHFHVAPSAQATGILGAPFGSLAKHLWGGLTGHYPLLREGKASRLAMADLVFFVGLTALMAGVAGRTFYADIRRSEKVRAFPGVLEVCAILFAVALLYCCFDDTVIWHFSGFMKAATIFVFFVPFLMAWRGHRIPTFVLVAFLLMDAYFGARLWSIRLAGPTIAIPLFDIRCGALSFDEMPACRKTFVWRGRDLPGLVGRVDGNARVVSDRRHAGILSYGPYMDLPAGAYRLTVRYRRSDAGAGDDGSPPPASAPRGWRLGRFAHGAENVLAQGTFSERDSVATQDVVISERTAGVELQTYFDGRGRLELDSVEIAQIDVAPVP